MTDDELDSLRDAPELLAEPHPLLLAHDPELHVEMAAQWPPSHVPALGPEDERHESPTGALR